MTDDQFRKLKQLLLDVIARQAALDLRISKIEDDALRYHRTVMDAFACGPEAVDLPPDVEALFEAEDERAEEREKRLRS